jgi:hypothetical protein
VRIKVIRSGGFAGISEQLADVETTDLAPAVAQQVEHTVRVGADLFHYEVSVSDGERQHHVEYTDDGECPEAAPFRRLVELVSGLR